jgi:hypothetical protein
MFYENMQALIHGVCVSRNRDGENLRYITYGHATKNVANVSFGVLTAILKPEQNENLTRMGGGLQECTWLPPQLTSSPRL